MKTWPLALGGHSSASRSGRLGSGPVGPGPRTAFPACAGGATGGPSGTSAWMGLDRKDRRPMSSELT